MFDAPRSGIGSGADPIRQGVALGYRVIEEYLRQGQAFARGVPFPRSASSADEVAPQAVERMVQHATELATAWLDLWRSGTPLVPGAAPAPEHVRRAPPPPFDIEQPARMAARESGVGAAPSKSAASSTTQSPNASSLSPALPTVAVELRCRRPTVTSVELKPGAITRRLVAHDLRASDPSLPRIGGIQIDYDLASDTVQLSLTIGDDQAPATYSGLIVDEQTNLPCGSLTVSISE